MSVYEAFRDGIPKFIQYPYDGENPYISLPREFYSSYLKRHTDKLVYVPHSGVDEFSREDERDMYVLSQYGACSAVINADCVMLHSEDQKQRYLEMLEGFAGKKAVDVWKEKFTVVSRPDHKIENENPENDGKKRILYCIGENEIYEHDENWEEKIGERLSVFRENSDSIDMDVVFYPPEICEEGSDIDEILKKRNIKPLRKDMLWPAPRIRQTGSYSRRRPHFPGYNATDRG